MASFTSKPATPPNPFFTGNPVQTGSQGDFPQAVVNIVDAIPANETNDAVFQDVFSNNQASIFTDYKIRCRYEKDGHIYMMGITSPNGFLSASAAFVQLAQPTLLWIADWTACKTNEQPEIPNTQLTTVLTTGQPGSIQGIWVLLDEQYETAEVVVGPDGISPLYRISGTYIYGCVNADPVTTNDIVFPLVPWLKDTFPNGRNMPVSKLTGNIITES